MPSNVAHHQLLNGAPPSSPFGPDGTRPARDWRLLAVLLAASCLVPLLLNAVHLDIVLIPVFVLAIAAVVHVGGGLLDRLVIATFLLCGALLVLGVGASLCPWGLAPVPVSQILLGLISAAAWGARRRPRIPLRVRFSDLLVLGTGAGIWHYAHHPVSGLSAVDRLVYIVTAEDRLTHFSIFDTIHRVGGFTFFHQEASRVSVMPPTEAVYPQGSHFLWAWFDVFFRSNTDMGSPLEAYSRYFTYVLISQALLGALLVWAARWIGGPRLRGWRTAAVCSTVAAVTVSSPLMLLFPTGFDSEIVGLLFLAVAVALLVRPAMRTVEFALVAISALVTVAYSYNLYAAFVGVILLASLLVHRRRHRGHRWALYGTLAVGLGVAVIPSAIMVLSSFDVKGQASEPGSILPMSRSVLIFLALVVPTAYAVTVRRRGATLQMLLLTVLASAGILTVFGYWQLHTIGKLSYYFEKLAVGAFVIGLLSLGAAVFLLGPLKGFRSSAPKRLAANVTAGVLVSAAAASLFAGVQWGVPGIVGTQSPWAHGPLLKWSRGELKGSQAVADGARTFALRDSKQFTAPVITLYTDNGYQNWRISFFAQTLLHQTGAARRFNMVLLANFGGGAPIDDTAYKAALADLQESVNEGDRPATILVADRTLVDRLHRDLTYRNTTQKINVFYAPLLSR